MADSLTNQISGATTYSLMEYRGHINVLKNQYRQKLYKENPTYTTIYENSSVAKIDLNNTKNSVKNVSTMTKKAREAGTNEAKKILSNLVGDKLSEKIIDNVQSADPIKSFNDYKEFEASKPASVLDAEKKAKNEDEQDAINARVGTTEPNASAKPFGYLDNFKDKRAAMELLKTCIPCEFRKIKFSAEFGLPWANTLDDLKKKWKDLLKLLKDLLAFQSGEFSKDLCNLFKFLDGQCIPDLIGLLSLLSIMELKYSDLGLTSLNNILSQLLTPFLSPVIGSFTTNLDQFSDLIIGPLKCIVTSLEYQMNNLQTQINGANAIADKNRTKYYKQELEFIDRKAKALRNRLVQINKDLNQNKDDKKKNRIIQNSEGGYVQSRGAVSKYFGELDFQNKDILLSLKTEEKNILNTNETSNAEDNPKSELKKLDKRRKELISLINIASDNPKTPEEREAVKNKINIEVNFSKATTMTAQTRYALSNMEKAYKSILGDLVDAINDGVGLIKQSIEVYREEFQRLILGRITTQEDQIEFTRSLQKIARLKSIVSAVSEFKKAGYNLKKLCEQGNDTAMSQIAKQLKETNSGMFDFYQAQDADGNSLMVIAPGGAKLTVNGIDFNKMGDDSLIGDTSLDSLKTTVSFNDLNEVDKMNREGILPNLGNIDSKNIELDNGFKSGSELDLHFKQSYAIISNEFCSKSAIDFGSSDTVKQWAANLWQKE